MSFKSFRCVATVALVLASVGVPSAQDTVSATNTTSTNSCAGSVGAGITPAHYFDLDKMMGTWYIHTVWIGDAADVREPDGRCQDTVFARRGPLLVGSTEHFINRTDNTNRTIESESRIEENKLQSIWASYLNNERIADIIWVQTSYTDWSLSYHCQMTASTFRSEMMVLWVRNSQRLIESNTFEMLKTVAKGYGFLPNHILPINNTACYL